LQGYVDLSQERPHDYNDDGGGGGANDDKNALV
jgi:hypothetical protein